MTGDIVEKDKMVFAGLSDLEMASKVRMLMRGDLDHEAVCTGARDRIMYLSQEVGRLRSTLQRIADPPDICHQPSVAGLMRRTAQAALSESV